MKHCVIFCYYFIFLSVLQCYAQNGCDSIRKYAILNYIITHQSEINTYLKNNNSDWLIKRKKIYVSTDIKKVELSVVLKDKDTELLKICGKSKRELLDLYFIF